MPALSAPFIIIFRHPRHRARPVGEYSNLSFRVGDLTGVRVGDVLTGAMMMMISCFELFGCTLSTVVGAKLPSGISMTDCDEFHQLINQTSERSGSGCSYDEMQSSHCQQNVFADLCVDIFILQLLRSRSMLCRYVRGRT